MELKEKLREATLAYHLLLNLEKVKDKTNKDNVIKENYLLINQSILDANKNSEILLKELALFKQKQGYSSYSKGQDAKTCPIKKFRYGELLRPQEEKKIALTDEELFILACNFPFTYQQRIEICNMKEKECSENKNYLLFVLTQDIKGLNRLERCFERSK